MHRLHARCKNPKHMVPSAGEVLVEGGTRSHSPVCCSLPLNRSLGCAFAGLLSPAPPRLCVELCPLTAHSAVLYKTQTEWEQSDRTLKQAMKGRTCVVGGWVGGWGARKQARQASSRVDSSGRGVCSVMVQGQAGGSDGAGSANKDGRN